MFLRQIKYVSLNTHIVIMTKEGKTVTVESQCLNMFFLFYFFIQKQHTIENTQNLGSHTLRTGG